MEPMKNAAFLTVLALVGSCGPALAEGDGYAAPAGTANTTWQCIAIAAVALLGIAAVAFKNAKRTHLD